MKNYNVKIKIIDNNYIKRKIFYNKKRKEINQNT